MKKLVLGIFLFCGLSFLSSAMAQENRYYIADRELQVVYEHFMDESLEKSINDMIFEEKISQDIAVDIYVLLNYGGPDNRMYIGKQNRIDFLIMSNVDLAALSIGFEFQTEIDTFFWVSHPDSIPGPDEDSVILKTPLNSPVGNVVKYHINAFDYGIGQPWTWVSARAGSDSAIIDSIFFGAIQIPGDFSRYLSSTFRYTPLFSMYIEIPDNPNLVGETFCIDNIKFSSGGDWIATGTGINGESYYPHFQSNPNNPGAADAPPVCFEIAEPFCESYEKKPGSNVVQLNPDEISVQKPFIDFNLLDHRPINKDGNRLIGVIIIFEDKRVDLSEYIERSDPAFTTDKYMMAIIPINNLPSICQNSGVRNVLYSRPPKKFFSY